MPHPSLMRAPSDPPVEAMAWIPGGAFRMGSDAFYPEERPAHRVTVDGFWMVVTGIAEVVVAIRLRKVVEGEWLLIVAGVLAVVFGVLLFVFPGAGALAMVL